MVQEALMERYIVFGTGSGGQRVVNMLRQYPDIEITYCLDNYPKSSVFMDIPVIKAGDFLKREDKAGYYYCIASVYKDEITHQLLGNGIQDGNILTETDIFLNHIDEAGRQVVYKTLNNDVWQAVFDLSCGFCLGGVEKWSYNLAAGLARRGKKIKLLSNNSDGMPPGHLEDYAVKSGVENFWDFKIKSIQTLTDELVKCMPCTVFVAHMSDLMAACILLKRKYPEKIKVFSVVHGGLEYLVHDNRAVLDYIDYVLCVSSDMYKALVNKEDARRNKILFKETPVNITDISTKEYTLDSRQPVKIAYAARLEKLHKHSELLIPLIEKLEEKKAAYVLDIAGDGGLFGMVNSFVDGNNLSGKVHLLGQLEYKEMESFWLKHDISVNLSECEGCSMSMLESMSAGAVPVYTDVFSTRHFIEDGKNGFVVSYNDIEKMAGCILELERDRERMTCMGKAAHNVIAGKCGLDGYIDFLLGYIDGKVI